MQRTTISDVAAVAGVSVATVSRSFTNPDLVHADTRERVLEIAREMAYLPNRAARGLITGRTGNLGVVVPDVSNPFFSALVKGVNARAREADCVVFLADTEEDPRTEEDLVGAMLKQVDGIVLCSSRMTTEQIRKIYAVTPLVLVNRQGDAPAVLFDNAGGTRQAVRHLADLGHTRIAYASGPPSSWSNRERHRAFSAATRNEGVVLGPFAPTYEGGVQAARLAAAAEVTAVVAFNDLMALGVMSELAATGKRVPDDVSVIGFDGIPTGAMVTPPLTTVSLPMTQAGRVAVDLMLEFLAQPASGAPEQLLDAHLLVRASTAPPRTTEGST